MFRNSIVLFGGKNYSGGFTNNLVSAKMTDSLQDPLLFVSPKTIGKGPSPRMLHSMCLIPESILAN